MKLGLAFFAFLPALLVYQSSAQSTSGCTQVLMKLTPCLNYVTGNSSTPSSTCCSTLSSVVQSQPQCLCLLLNGAAPSVGYNINQTLALALPGACSVKTPSTSLCNAVSPSPSSTPTTSAPAAVSPSTSSTPTTSAPAAVSPSTSSTPTTSAPPAVSPSPSLSSAPTTSPPADSSDDTPLAPTDSSIPPLPSGSRDIPATPGLASDASKSVKVCFGSLVFVLLLASFGSSSVVNF